MQSHPRTSRSERDEATEKNIKIYTIFSYAMRIHFPILLSLQSDWSTQRISSSASRTEGKWQTFLAKFNFLSLLFVRIFVRRMCTLATFGRGASECVYVCVDSTAFLTFYNSHNERLCFLNNFARTACTNVPILCSPFLFSTLNLIQSLPPSTRNPHRPR